MIVPYTEVPTHTDENLREVKSAYFNCAQQALWNLCLVLKPRYILDIGTMGGTSALLAAQYLEKNAPDGHVVTADVVTTKKAGAWEHPLVTKVLVYPHSRKGLRQYPWARGNQSLKHSSRDSARLNAEIMIQALEAAGGDRFDLAYVDGDHSKVGLLRDLEIVKRITAPPHYALLDDVYMPGVPAGELYREDLVHRYEHYDFEGDGWETFKETRRHVWGMPRMALIWEKE